MCDAGQWRRCGAVERHVALRDAVRLRVRGDEGSPGGEDARRASETRAEGVLSAKRILRYEALDAGG